MEAHKEEGLETFFTATMLKECTLEYTLRQTPTDLHSQLVLYNSAGHTISQEVIR